MNLHSHKGSCWPRVPYIALIFAACWLLPACVSAQPDSSPLRIVVTHVQDRSDTDDHLWLRELLASQMRLLLSAAGAEVVDYRHLPAMALEESIEDMGLPGIFADGEANVAAPDMTLTGEYRVAGERIEVSFVLSHVDPPEAAGQAHYTGALGDLDEGMRRLALDILRRAEQPPDGGAREKLRTIPLPTHSFARWFGEAQVYSEQGFLPEAWYCATLALREQPNDLRTRRLLATAYRDMGMYDHAALAMDALIDAEPTDPRAQEQEAADWDDVDVETRLSWMYWAWTDFEDLDELVTQVLAATQPTTLAADHLVADVVAAQTAQLFTDFRRVWTGHYDIIDNKTHADVDLFEKLLASAYRLRWCERMARYWASKQRDERSAAWRTKTLDEWRRMLPVLQSHGVSPERVAACNQQIERLLGSITAASAAARVPSIRFTPFQKPERVHDLLEQQLDDGMTWSDVAVVPWPREFHPTQVLADRKGGRIAVGMVELPKTSDGFDRTALAWMRTDDGAQWTEPRLFPPPINLPGARSAYPILLTRPDGSFVLGWLSNRDGFKSWVYVARSRDLVHWSNAVRTPAVGQFDMAALPDGSVMIASHNTRITRSQDLVAWSIPRLAVHHFNMQMDYPYDALDETEWPRLPRLIVAEDGRIHLLTLVEPGADPDPNERMLIHAASEDGALWRPTLARRHVDDGSDVDPPRYHAPIAAEALPGGGVAMLLREIDAVSVNMPKGPVERKQPAYAVVRTLDGRTWERVVTLNTPFDGFAEARPSWGGMLRRPDESLEVAFNLRNAKGCRQTISLSAALIRASGETVPDREEPDEWWFEDPTTRKRCIVVVSHRGQSEPELIADSFGVLLQMDLGQLEGVVPLMAVPLRSGVEFDQADFRTQLADPRIRWADDVVQIDVRRAPPAEWQVRIRIIDVKRAEVSLARTYTATEAQLPEIGRTISRDVRAFIGAGPRDSRARHLETEYLRDARSLRYLAAVVLFDHPRRTYPGYVVQEWAETVPDAPLLNDLAHLLTDELEQSRLAMRLRSRSWRVPGAIDDYGGVIPLNPFKLSLIPTESANAIARERLLRLIPDCLPLRIHVLEGWLTEGFADRAQPHLDYLAANYADSSEATAACARAYEYLSDHTAAAATWQRFLASWPDDLQLWPYWYGDRWDEGKQLAAPARVRLAMAETARGASTREHLTAMREWYSSFRVPINESADRMLALSMYTYGLLVSGETARLVSEIWPELHAPERGPRGIYRFPATVHFIGALVAENQTRRARDYLTYLLTEGYWYDDHSRAFQCPPESALQEQLRRMQVYRPLMGE
jgi:tetratricopeptide (TPR) repeat protein